MSKMSGSTSARPVEPASARRWARRHPTLGDVARLARVSAITVSRVVNGSVHVRPETRSRVLAAVEELRYRPNELARNLKTRRSHAVGLLIDVSNPFYAACATGAESVFRERGYALILASSRPSAAEEEATVELLGSYQADGLLIVPTVGSYEFLARLPSGQPIVALDRPFDRFSTDVVLVKNYEGARAAVTHLLKHGRETIAFVGADETAYTTRLRLEGYTDAIRAAGVPGLIRLGAMDVAAAASITRELIHSADRPSAVFAMNNLITVGVLEAITEAGLRVPDDIAVVGFDDVVLADVLHPRLTVVRQPAVEMGRRAAELLLSRLSGCEPVQPQTILLETELLIRESCGCTSSQRSVDTTGGAT